MLLYKTKIIDIRAFDNLIIIGKFFLGDTVAFQDNNS
jgi:hypothetical protein